ncbi:hypothetical protein EPN96_06920 [bacterium]|nr:MAG: hypothetical protein EPN96_06920 [bacterium]
MFLKNYLPEPPVRQSARLFAEEDQNPYQPPSPAVETGEKSGGIISSLLTSLGGLFSGEPSPVTDAGDTAVAGEGTVFERPKPGRAEQKRIENEWRAYHQALDSAWRSYHVGEEGAGAQNALDQGLGNLFDRERTEGKEIMERYNRSVGARLGAEARIDEDVPRLVHEAWERGDLLYDEEGPAYRRLSGEGQGDEFVGPPAPPGLPPNGTETPAETPPEAPAETPDERGMRLGRELFGTP